MTDYKWDQRFLGLAKHIAGWSKDPSTKVGAILVDDSNIIVGIGYNGFPRGVADSEDRYADRALKHRYVVHAETNALLNANAPVAGCTLYVWPLPPCAECAKLIVQAGIRRVVAVAPDDEAFGRWEESFHAAADMFSEAGVDDEWLEEDFV